VGAAFSAEATWIDWRFNALKMAPATPLETGRPTPRSSQVEVENDPELPPRHQESSPSGPRRKRGSPKQQATKVGATRIAATKLAAPRNGARIATPKNGSSKRPHGGSDTVIRDELDRLLAALRAARQGDFSVRVHFDRVATNGHAAAADTMRSIATEWNELMSLNAALANEMVRVERVVGREGRMNERAALREMNGGWAASVGSINALIGDLVQPTTEVARVISAVADGDFTQKMALEIEGQPVKGEFLRIGTTVNGMVAQLSSFASEVTRVAKEVGTDGKLGGQAQVPEAAGVWRDLTDNVNLLANNLTAQVRNIAEVTTAVAKGDLSKKITVDARGEVLEVKNTVNTMVDQLNIFAEQVTSVARTVGVEGKLGAQAEVPGVAGTWKDLTDNVNLLANNLTAQVRNIAEVTTAVATGDLSKKITVDAKGEVLELKSTINTMVDQLRSFAGEVTRVAKEVGTEGKLGGQADVKGVSGTWKDLTDNVNVLAGNLTAQVRNIALVTTAVANGDLSQKITVSVKGEVLELKNTINTMVDQLRAFASEVTRVAREVGTDGKLGGQAQVPGVSGTWKDLTDNVNLLAGNLTDQVRNIAKVTTAVANGDLSQKITVDVKGEILELKNTINTMVDQLNAFASEVTRVAKEVGTEGKLGGQAEVPGVAGVWKNLTDNVNFMARNLTAQVRGIVKVVTAVANGDLKQKMIGVEAKGEVAALADTINNMCDTLGTFADQVSTVAREVGIEGKLGGQAKVPGAVGTWRQLTDNVNQLAGNLTTQVRAISEVSDAVTKGDLTRSIEVEAQGEVAALKDKINQMIINLRETTQKNAEQDWLKTNLAKFSSMMQGQKNLETVSRLIMSELTPLVSAHHGAFFMMDWEGNGQVLKLTSTYAYRERKNVANRFRPGEGLIGQCALEKKTILLSRVPSDYIQINSGLGEAPPLTIIVLPVLFEGEVKAVIELASFQTFSAIHQLFLDQLTESIGVVLNMISANMRTEELLQQSQSLTQELQSQSKELTVQQDELKRTNAALEKQAIELEEKARLLAEQNSKVEIKNHEVEQARLAIEEKAEQLSMISKYKSEFLANMSHELRTPLNSLLILAKLLSDNSDANLTDKQVEYAKTIYASGGDLLTLINEILDLTKVEAGKMPVEPRDLPLSEVAEFVERTFRPIAEQKPLAFAVDVDGEVPPQIHTDPLRLQQVLKNLLANAFKFTERGSVKLRVHHPPAGVRYMNDTLRSGSVVAFSVVDTGIGIAKEKQQLIFEAFQQADGTTSRKYGGTGLGLSISRELARLLGGEIHVESELGRGSTFTLYLPEYHDMLTTDEEGAGAAPGEEQLGSWMAPRGHTFDRVVGAPALAEPDPIVTRPIEDDRATLAEGDRVLLVVEDDVSFARIMLQIAHDSGFKVLVAGRGDIALDLARRYRPDAITLDIQLPDVDGWTVMDRLKRSPNTRHIPVHVISVDERSRRGAALGAFSYLEKPVSREALESAFQHITTFLDRKVRLLLLVEDDDTQRSSIVELVGEGNDVKVTTARTAEDALVALDSGEFDCMVVDLVLPGDDGIHLIEKVRARAKYRDLPIIVYTGKDLTPTDEEALKTYAQSVILKSGIHSPERLLSETALFLHRVESTLPERSKAVIEASRQHEGTIAGRKVLVVDDDVRNIFAMTSILEANGLEVSYAETGQAGIEALNRDASIDLVLMDVMMPGMDGYETIRAIRANPALRGKPVIAITAKALKDDRDKCLAAGASDYIPKPVDTQRLLDLIHLWISGEPREARS
jgi:signal transduction histidine kinase/CheY-like chemotaxis protein/HAMP domain-containing protein